MYTYVHNNPLINIDPSGHACQSVDGNYTHLGGCSSSDSIFIPDDLYIASTDKESDLYGKSFQDLRDNHWEADGNAQSDFVTDFVFDSAVTLGAAGGVRLAKAGLSKAWSWGKSLLSNGANNTLEWSGKNFSQIGKNMSPDELISNLENSGWTKTIEPGGKKSGPATILTDPATGTKVRIHSGPGEGIPYFRVQNKGGGYLDDNGVFPSNATRQELRDATHFYFGQ